MACACAAFSVLLGRCVIPVEVTDPRRCADCAQWKPLAAFYVKSWDYGKPRYDSSCKACRNARTKEYQHRPEHVEHVREYKRRWHKERGEHRQREALYRRRQHADVLAFDVQNTAQSGRCAICLRPPAEGEMRFAFDHDHATGLSRGVLCPAYNGALGCLRDRRDLLLAALRYLEYWERQHVLAEGA